MGESLMQRRCVEEEGLRVVNSFSGGRISRRGNASTMTVPQEQASANFVPAAAVKRRRRALSGITGRKGRLGGLLSQLLKSSAQLGKVG